ncbi:Holliday junction resolvase RuvX [bacterium]|nr:Holliday junction resolvase RuvX [bacterium]
MANKLLLGIDWGEARIGLALGSTETKIASPYKVVSQRDKVLEIIVKEEIDEIILGKPVALSGDNKLVNKDFLNFKGWLEKKVKQPVFLIDERLTSKAADALAGAKKQKVSRDAVAAMLILQAYLDSSL